MEEMLTMSPVAILAHGGQHRLNTVDGAKVVGLKDLAMFYFRCQFQRGRATDTGIIHQ